MYNTIKSGGIMKTTLNIPESLIEEAMTISKSKSKTETVIAGLNELIRRQKIERVLEGVGKVKIRDNWDKMRHER